MIDNLISIVVPIYNVEKYVKQCVDSILGQSYKKIEILLIDDGSTDLSGQICDSYKSVDERIQVVHKQNGGLSDARNAGIRLAAGKYITFIDSDDAIEVDFVKYLFEMIEDNAADMAVCQYQKTDEAGNPVGSGAAQFGNQIISGNENCMSKFFTDGDIGTVAWGKLYKTEFFENVTYPVGKYHEDVYTTYKLVALCESIAIGGERKYYYRQRKNSIVNQSFTLKHLDGVEANIERSAFVLKNYPKLYGYACAGIIYSANQCALKLINTKGKHKEEMKYLQRQYKLYTADYVKMTKSVPAKLFAIFAKINLPLLIKTCKPFGRFFK